MNEPAQDLGKNPGGERIESLGEGNRLQKRVEDKDSEKKYGSK